MKAIIYKIGNKTLYLAYNGEAMFAIEELHGGIKELPEKLNNKDRESFKSTCEVAALLAEQGELVRRYYGHEPQDIIAADDLRSIIQPSQIAEMTDAIFRSIALGYGSEIDRGKDDEIDLVLMELNQKKTN